jgi:hypothetical protein
MFNAARAAKDEGNREDARKRKMGCQRSDAIAVAGLPVFGGVNV